MSFVDSFVDSWVKEHPELTSLELDRILAAAKAAKAAVLVPAPAKSAETALVTRPGEHRATRHVRSDNSTVGGYSTLADAKALSSKLRRRQIAATRSGSNTPV